MIATSPASVDERLVHVIEEEDLLQLTRPTSTKLGSIFPGFAGPSKLGRSPDDPFE